MSSRYDPSFELQSTPARSQAGAVRATRRGGQPAAQTEPSPITTRSGRALGSIGSKNGPSYSPYARRTGASAASHPAVDADSPTHDAVARAPPMTAPAKRSGGLFSGIKSIPGRALGYIFHRSITTANLSSSASLQDVRRAVEHGVANSTSSSSSRSPKGAVASRTRSSAAQQVALPRSNGGGGLTRSKTTTNLSHQLASSSSLSALSSYAAPPPPPTQSTSTPTSNANLLPRSSHSTLTMPTAGNGPSFLASTSYSRQASPAPSSTAGYSRRSPSPTRAQLAGSMSAFNFASSGADNPYGADARMAAPSSRAGSSYGGATSNLASNPFGLQSRSPFASAGRAPSIARSVSVSSTSHAVGGHSLFPYASPVPRGASPGTMSTSRSVSSSLNHKKSYVALGSPRARVGSPLNPQYPASSAGGSVFGAPASEGGFERARKKQMVWDPEKGLVSREAMERERDAALPPPPKNEAERILEVLEGMGRTPLGDAKRGAVRPINVPAPEPSTSSLLSRSASTPLLSAASPYGRRPAAPAARESRGIGLEAQLRAREERRRAQIEREREERERERQEDEERERERTERRRRRRDEEERLRREEEDDMMLEAIEDEDVPRRKTRSMAAAAASKTTSPPSKARVGKAKATAAVTPKPTRRSTRKIAASVADDDESQAEDVPMSPPSRRRTVKSPSPVRRAVRSPSPIPEASPSPPCTTEPASTYKPITQAERAANASSSLRPGRSHTSRTHTSSSKVFSAREEDLPPVDDNDLGKIKLPEMKFPANFSFGPMATKPATTAASSSATSASAPAPASAKEVPLASIAPPTNGLFGRLGPAPTESTSKPAHAPFSFGPPPPKADVASAPVLPKTSSSVGSDFFSKPAASSLPSSTSDASMTSTKAPTFFAHVAEKKEVPAPPLPSLPSASDFFGVAKTAEKKKDDAPSPSTASPVPAANPFAAFGKPVAEIVGSAAAEKKVAPTAAAPLFGAASNGSSAPANSFGASAAPMSGLFGAPPKENGEKKDPADAKPAFSFAPATSTAPSAPAPFSFGVNPTPSTAEKKNEDKPAAAAPAPFSFGASAASSSTNAAPKPAFGLGQSAVVDKKKNEGAASADGTASKPPTSFAGFGTGSTPAAPVVMPALEDADEDSGMEDETGATDSSVAAKPAAPAPFTFGAAPAASSSTPSPFGGASATNGASAAPAPFAFGAVPKADAPKPVALGLFGAAPSSSAAPGSSSLFGGASASASPAFGRFSPSPSPSPGPASAGVTGTGFAFGASAPPAATASSAPAPFTFGSMSSAAPPSASGVFGSSATPPNPFGAASATAPAMYQTLSAPGFGNAAPAGATSPFGAPTATPSFAFGANGASSNPGTPTTTTSSFNFGAPSSSTGQLPSFGGAAGATNGVASSFGAPSNAAGGFSFGAPAGPGSTTPGAGTAPGSPAAGAPGGTLFSIGSGGDESPNKRKIAPLRRRRG